ncbi:MAG: cyclase family protein [Planctomycetota bacterium]
MQPKVKRIVDLTRLADLNTEISEAYPRPRRADHFSYANKIGPYSVHAEEYTFVGQWGTHLDAPSHFSQGGRSISDIPVDDLFIPLVVVDVREQVENSAGYEIELQDLLRHERQFGTIPRGSFVAVCSGWSQMAMRGAPKQAAPGWSLSALRYLVESKKVVGVGHEPLDTDPGLKALAGEYPAEEYLLVHDCYQIEGLCNLDTLIGCEGFVSIGVPLIAGSPGFPVRVLAIEFA